MLTLLAGFFLITCSKESETEDTPTVGLAVLSTTALSGITQTSAQTCGTITSDGGSNVTARGVCWNTAPSPTITNQKTVNGTGTGTFSATLTSLASGTKYYVRAYATNGKGTAYGNELSFTTASPVYTVTDIDGNLYHGITIGTQVWLVENLRTTKYRNGDAIPNITDQTQWAGLTTGAYCAYGNNQANASVYGYLYNFFAVTDPRGIAPPGYHVASKGEWQTLSDFLGGNSVSGGKLKESGTAHWQAPNDAATNSSGFTALPCGRRIDGGFETIKTNGYFWTSTLDNVFPMSFYLCNDLESILYYGLYGAETYGKGVRCVKD